MEAERITPAELRDALAGFYLDVNHGGSIVKGTVCDPAEVADVIFCQLSANRAHEPGSVVDADIPDPEVTAIAAIVAAMDALDGETALLGTDVHERVIRWAMARYLGPAA